MVKTIGIFIVILLAVSVGGILAYAATKPDTFRVRRATSINAPPEKIFSLLNDFRRWGEWSPYETKDPAMKRTFTGSAAGKGAVYAFEGNGQVGAGRLEIVDTAAPSKVTLTLDMIKPMQAHNVVEFTLEPQGDSTNVTWARHGRSPYVAKIIQTVFDMDGMVGKDFETGLANLRTVAEQ